MRLEKLQREGRQPDPGWETQFVSLLEDFGVVNIKDKKITFDTAMFGYGFFLPDAVINALAVFSALYGVHMAGFI
ncbi:hypothetical protein AUJ15_00445 [Candidatus Micrarchaeota archaeon CG1_02_55_41]|nr:MAG: hypothetical protein AUJ15_00445 [Candidatus Micrarchaeota archaeon CG1_02_55_41]